MSTPSIEVAGLRKRYGSTAALDGMSFGVFPGRVTGFVGPNGAGKSTTVRVILGLDAPDEGRALIGGMTYGRLRYPLRHVGALLDASAVQPGPGRSGRNHLLWLARSQGLAAARVDAVLELVGLGAAARRRAGGYSLGMRQRLGIAAAVLGDPAVIVMDEPFNGMDPEGIIWMRRLVRSFAAEGRAILVSSHLMSELQDLADQVVVIGRGKVLADAGIDDLVGRGSGHQVVLRTAAPADAAEALHGAGATVTRTDAGTLAVSGIAAQHVVEVLARAGVRFSEVTTRRATLEDVYLQLTGDEGEFAAASERQARR